MPFPDDGKTAPVFPVICIGGSAGSLCAYIDILRQIPTKSGMAIVVVSHRSQRDLLISVLAKATAMEVVEVTDGMILEVGRVFVAPAHREMSTDGVRLSLARHFTEDYGTPKLVTQFLLSLASMCGPRTIAVIVSGMGGDGSTALSAVKKAGGRIFSQSDANYLQMPQAAVDTNCVDFELGAIEIGRYLALLSVASSFSGYVETLHLRQAQSYMEASLLDERSIYEIFRSSKVGPIWLETIAEFENASERMEQLAVEKPDLYFLASHTSQTVVAMLDRRADA